MLELLVQYTVANPAALATVLVLVMALVSAVRASGNLRQGLYALMLRAEKAWKEGEFGPVDGAAVMEKVLDLAMLRVVPMLPFWLRPFISRDVLRRTAQVLYDKAKDYLDDGKLNSSAP